MNLPPLLKDAGELNNLGISLNHEITHSETGKGSLPKRWERNEMLYNIDPDATNLNLVEGMESYPIPLWKPKADRIIGTVYKSVTGLEPYVQVIPESEDAADIEPAARLAKALTSLAKKRDDVFGFDRAFRQCLKIAVNTGIAILHTYAESGDSTTASGLNAPFTKGEIIDVAIHPKDFMIYPHELGTIRKATTVGHRYWRTRQEIDQLFDAGQLLTNEVGGADTVGERGGKSADFGETADTPVVDPRDHLIECWQLVTRRDLGEGLMDYVVQVCRKTQRVLAIDKLDYKTGRMYFDIRFDDEYGSFWPASSPGQDIQGTQLIFSDLFNVAIQGGYSSAFPGVALIGATLNAKQKRWGPGTVWELPSGASVEVIANTFNGEWIPKLIPLIEDVGDSTSRISRLGTSEQMPASTTATAAAGFLQGQAEGKDQYSDFVSSSIGEIFTFKRELLTVHYDDIKKAMNSDMGLKSYSDVMIAASIRATASSATSSPNTLLQKLQMAMQMSALPTTILDGPAVERAVLQALDLPFDTTTLERPPGPTPDEYQEIIIGLIQGQIQPEEAIQIIQEAKQDSASGAMPSPLQPPEPPQPQPHISEIVDSKLAAMMTPKEFGQFLSQIGITPDPARENMNEHPHASNPNGPGPDSGPPPGGNAGPQGQPGAPPPGNVPPGGAPPPA